MYEVACCEPIGQYEPAELPRGDEQGEGSKAGKESETMSTREKETGELRLQPILDRRAWKSRVHGESKKNRLTLTPRPSKHKRVHARSD